EKFPCHLCKAIGHWKSECPENDKNPGHGAMGYMAGKTLSSEWVNDSGADRHYCGRLEWFFEYAKYSEPELVTIADNSQMKSMGVGKVKVQALKNKQWLEIELHNV